jgi:hypothetical protein
VKGKEVTSPNPSACTPACCGEEGSPEPPTVEGLAAAILRLSAADRARLVALILRGDVPAAR